MPATARDIQTVLARLWRTRREEIRRPSLADAFQAEFYRRGWQRERYASEGQWITIGGASEGGKKHAGGTPVKVGPGGEIEAGPKGLEGKSMGQVDQDKQATLPRAAKPANREQAIAEREHSYRDAARQNSGELGLQPTGDDRRTAAGTAKRTDSPQPGKQKGLFGDTGPDNKKPQPVTPSGEKQKRLDLTDQEPAKQPEPAKPEEKPAEEPAKPKEAQKLAFPEPEDNQPQSRFHGVTEMPDGRWIGATTVNVNDLKVDPDRFQYKIAGVGAEGVTEELKDVKTFNPSFAGQLLVWHDPKDGQNYVVNGHHRYELASRSPHTQRWQGQLNVLFVDAETPEEARAEGALANIAEGRGTALDAAKFMRDSSMSAEDLEKEGIALTESLANRGATLAKLSNPLFRKLVDGMITEGRALAIASELGDNPKLQDEIFREVEAADAKKRETLPDYVVKEMASEAAQSPVKEEDVVDLFGSTKQQKALRIPRAVVRSAIQREIAADMRAHREVSKRGVAGRLAQTGTEVNVDASKEAAKQAEEDRWVFKKLAGSKGALSDVINQFAERYDAARTERERKSILAEAIKAGREAVRQALAGTESQGTQEYARNAGVPAESRIQRPGRPGGLIEHFAREFSARGWDRLNYARRKSAAGQSSMWDEKKHPRDKAGEFSSKGQGEPGKQAESLPGQRGLFGEDEHQPKTEAPKPKPAEPPVAQAPAKQQTLWHGLNDLPGQRDLFDMDLAGAREITPDMQRKQETRELARAFADEFGQRGLF